MDIETNPYPNIISSVPTLIYNGEAYFDEKMHAIIDDVNQHHIRENGSPAQPPHQAGSSAPKQKGKPGPPQGTQEQGMNIGDMRNPNLNQSIPQNDKTQGKSTDGPLNTDIIDGIMGICSGEDCLYENINDDKGFNNINQNYCFLDDNMDDMNKKNTSAKMETNKSEKETSRFDNNAYEEMMKNRGM